MPFGRICERGQGDEAWEWRRAIQGSEAQACWEGGWACRPPTPNVNPVTVSLKTGSAMARVTAATAAPRPVIVVPGIGGSLLSRGRARRNAWFTSRMLLDPGAWMRDVDVLYGGGRFSPLNPLRTHDFGGVGGICELVSIGDIVPFAGGRDTDRLLARAVGIQPYDGLVAGLRKAGVRVAGAPYDFRTILDPVVFHRYARDLTRLIRACERPPVLVTHSMGSVVAAAVLARSDAPCHAVIDVCPAYGGSWAASSAMRRGNTYVPLKDEGLRARAALTARRTAGLVLALPNPLAFPRPWADGDVGHRRLTSGAWRAAALPLIEDAARIVRSGAPPYGAAHTVVLSDRVEDTPCGPDPGDVAPGDGLLLPASALCVTSDRARVLFVAEHHRTAASCAATVRLAKRAAFE